MITEPNCSKRNCKHFLGVVQPDGTEASERPNCKAFPRGIPDEIAYGNNKHDKSYPGDNGIRFNPAGAK